ncbi:MAG: hypothetical protein ACTSRX_10355, partial [Promethearchaeota archaeon]
MQKESSNKKQTKRNLTERDLARQRRRTGDLSSSDNSDSDYCSEDDDVEVNPHEYRKMLAELWPSKFINNKIKAGERFKQVISQTTRDFDEDQQKKSSHKKYNRSNKNIKRSKLNHEEEDSEDDNQHQPIHTKRNHPKKSSKHSKLIREEDTETESDNEVKQPLRRSARLYTNKF